MTNPSAMTHEPSAPDAAPSYGSLAAIGQIPVTVQIVLGAVVMPVSRLMSLGRGEIIALDRRIGEPVDIVVNGRLVARGELVVLEDDNGRFGIALKTVMRDGHSDARA